MILKTIDIFSSLFIFLSGLASGFFCYKTLSLLLLFRNEWYKKAYLILGCFLLGGMVIFIGDLANLPPTMLIFVTAVLWVCKDSFFKKITLSLMICSAALSFNALIDSYFRNSFNFPRLFYWILLFFFIKKITPKTTFDLSTTYWKLVLLLTATPLGIVLSLVLLQNPYVSDNRYTDLSNCALLILSAFSIIGLFLTVTVLAKQQKLEEDHYLLEMNQNYYKNMEQQQYEIRRLRHDMANHLQTLASLPPENVSDYLASLTQDAAFYGIRTFCLDATVNAVLNTKYALINELSISFKHHISLKDTLPFAPSDVCALFSNFMDNAMEACEKIDGAHRKIVLNVKTGKGILAIEIKNTCEEKTTLLTF